ncbi:MAG: M48 family metallopeptidase [Saprospiraceae bacterium]|nr:M48 family metallopeptidase [Saprospiraceae bacterium]
MEKFFFILPLFLLMTSWSVSQDFDNYKLLKSTGKIPKDFLIPSSEKYKKEIERIDKNTRHSEQVAKKQFHLESNFLIDDLLQSARVLFNDPLTNYINRVADELLKNDPKTRQKLRFYAIRSTAVNAFATNQGIIFVNVGLLAQLESEAQLAFVLAHEIAHINHEHALNMFLESKKIDRFTSRSELMKKSSFDDRIVAKNFFSKKLEISADKEGLKIYLQSNYCLEELDGVFDVLQYSYLPFDVTPFKKEFFENEFITLPEEYFLSENELNGIDGEYEEESSKSTHPSIESRRDATAETIAQLSNSKRKKFLTDSEDKFLKVRDIARFELAYYYLHEFKYQEAIYACYILQQKYPNSLYLKKIIAKSLYGYTKFKNEIKGVKPYSFSHNDDNIDTEIMSKDAHENIEGATQQIYYFLAQLETNELTVLALRYAWDVHKTKTTDKELNTILNDLFLELAYHYKKRSEFSSQSIQELEIQNIKNNLKDSIDNIKRKPKEIKLSKYDKIKDQKKNQDNIKAEEISPYEFAKYAFRDILKDKNFKKLFTKGQREKERRQSLNEYYSSNEGRIELRKKNKRNAVALGIDSILVYKPYYVKIHDLGKTSKILYLKSEETQNKLVEIIRKNAKIANVNINLLNPTDIKESDAETYNDLRILSDWMYQQNRFGSNLLMSGFNQEATDLIIKKFNTRYLLFTGIVSLKRTSTNWIYWSVLFDLKTGRYQVIKDDYFNQKDNKAVLNAHIFDTFFQIKSERKQL